VAAFTLAYLGLASLFALSRGNLEFLLYIAVVLGLMPAVWLVHRRVGLCTASLWALSLWGLLHMAGGLVRVPAGWPTQGEHAVLYSLWILPGRLKYDHLVHAYGFGVTTWVCWQGLRSLVASREGAGAAGFGTLVLAAAAGMGFGALNELIEFAATLLVPETNVGGYLNTGWDLVANLVGATLAVLLIRLVHRRRPGGPA
jgi:uncharacterized membrane protein YjdF